MKLERMINMAYILGRLISWNIELGLLIGIWKHLVDVIPAEKRNTEIVCSLELEAREMNRIDEILERK